ncbi:MAG TPA: regulatory protein RecX [Acidobacteriota bacterium]|nr:regulatory protein RecX [Acidobacteriota bacterium]
MTSARERAIFYLSRFARTERQVESYLKRKGFPPEEIQDALIYLREHSYLNDDSFATSFIESRIRHGDGPLKIKQMLFGKGISATQSDALLKSLYPEEIQIERLNELIQKHQQKGRERLQRFLASRGFPRYAIFRAFSIAKPKRNE